MCVFGDGGVEVCDIELDEGYIVLVGYSCEPVGNGFGVLPLVKLLFVCELCVYIIYNVLADFSYFRFYGVD